MAVTQEQLDMFRHVVQKIITPLIFVVGVMGNTLSIVVLTRKRMRCSTNVYLTGLAVSDLLYLVMYFIMSLRHYEIMHTYKMYYSLMGLFHWLIDSFSYISIYIVVSFTIERYIAVCHPIRGQRLCTEARAKKVIGIIVVVVMLSILSTAFEYQLNHQTRFTDSITKKPCNISEITSSLPFAKRAAGTVSSDDKANRFTTVPNQMDRNFITEEDMNKTNTGDEFDVVVPRNENEMNGTQKHLQTNNSTCVPSNYYDYKASALSANQYYVIFYFATSFIYAGIPLILLITFNTFLIIAVRKSNKLRKDMTNNVNSRQIKQKLSSMTHENKITITLIAVVILFIICQSPWVFTTIAMNFDFYKDTVDDNLERLISNIANLLVAINAAANFVLYCLLSDKYRRTVRELIMGHQYMRQGTLSSSILTRQTTLGSSWYNKSWRHGNLNDSQKIKPSPVKELPMPDHHLRKASTNNNFTSFDQSNFITIPEENERKLSDVSRINFVPTDHSISSTPNYLDDRRISSFMPQDTRGYMISSPNHENHRPNRPPSFGPTDRIGGIWPNEVAYRRQSSFGPYDHSRSNNNGRKESIMSAMFSEDKDMRPLRTPLPESCSQHSLTRSLSLDDQPKIRHSPGCKDFPYNL